MTEIPQYPRIPHDKKKSVKLKLEDIEKIRHLWESGTNKNIKLLSEIFKVSQPTIKYWIDPEFRQKVIKNSSERHSKRCRYDEKYLEHKKEHLKKFISERYQKDQLFKKYRDTIKNKAMKTAYHSDITNSRLKGRIRQLRYRLNHPSHNDKLKVDFRRYKRKRTLSAFRTFMNQYG